MVADPLISRQDSRHKVKTPCDILMFPFSFLFQPPKTDVQTSPDTAQSLQPPWIPGIAQPHRQMTQATPRQHLMGGTDWFVLQEIRTSLNQPAEPELRQ